MPRIIAFLPFRNWSPSSGETLCVSVIQLYAEPGSRSRRYGPSSPCHCQLLEALCTRRQRRSFQRCDWAERFVQQKNPGTPEMIHLNIHLSETKASRKSESGQIGQISRCEQFFVSSVSNINWDSQFPNPWIMEFLLDLGCGLLQSGQSVKHALFVWLQIKCQMMHSDGFCIILHNLAQFTLGSCKYFGRILPGFIVSELSHLSLAPEPGVIDSNFSVLIASCQKLAAPGEKLISEAGLRVWFTKSCSSGDDYHMWRPWQCTVLPLEVEMKPRNWTSLA